MASAEFFDRNLNTRFYEDITNTGAGWYQVECECVDETIVRRVPQAEFVSQDEDTTRHYRVVITYEEMAAAGITRHPTVRLRTISADGHVSSRYTTIEAHNPPPEITQLPVCRAALESAEVYIVPPDASDVVGYLASVSAVDTWEPDVASAHDFLTNQFNIPLGTSNSTYWVRFAAYDSFGKDELIWTPAQPISGFNASFDEFEELADEVREAADEIREGGYVKRDELAGVAETILKGQVESVHERAERISSTWMSGEPMGAVLERNVEHTDDLIEITDAMVVWNEDKSALIIKSESVQVRDGVSIAKMETDLAAATETARTDAFSAIELVANDLSAEVDAREEFYAEYEDNKAEVVETFHLLADETTALLEFQNVLSASGVQGGTIILDGDKVMYSPTETIAQRNSLIDSQFNGTAEGASRSFLLQTAETAASNGAAAVNTLTQMGVEIDNGSAWNLDASKVEIGPGGELLSTRLTSIGSELAGKVNESNFQARVDSRVDVKVGPGSAVATAIQSAQSTANGASASASIALSTAQGNTASIGIWTMVGNTATGIKVNGATQAIQMVAGQIAFVSTVGGTPVMPLQVVGNKVIATNFQADDIKAGTVTANMVKANNLTETTTLQNNGSVGLSGGEQQLVGGSVYVEGKVDLHVWLNFSQSSGSPGGAICTLYRNGSPLDTFGTFCQGAWGNNVGTAMVTDYPGTGWHSYTVGAYTSPGSSGNPTKTRARITANVKKTEA